MSGTATGEVAATTQREDGSLEGGGLSLAAAGGAGCAVSVTKY